MKKFLAVFLAAVLLLVFAGCAKKTEPEKKQESGPAPKSGDINFSIIDPAGAPGKLVDLVNRLKTSESATLAEADDGVYVLITRGEQPTGGYEAKVEKVTQSVSDQKGFATVRLMYTDPKPGQVVSQGVTYPLALVKLDSGKKPDEMTFIIQREKPGTRTTEGNSSASNKSKEQQEEKTVNIIVDQPKPQATVISPFLVSGRARVFEATFQVHLVDEEGKTISRKTVMASAGAPEWGKFTTSIQYTAPAAPRKATLQVYTLSAKDGSVQDLVKIPLTLK